MDGTEPVTGPSSSNAAGHASEPAPAPRPSAVAPTPPPTVAELFPAPVQAFLFLVLFGLVGAVAWTSFRGSPTPAPLPELSRAGKVDLNRADRAELMLLPGIGPQMAD